MKRILDVLISLFIIVAGFAIIFLIILVDFIFTKQFPVIFQKRSVSLNNGVINLYKIRTIKRHSETSKLKRLSSNILKKEDYKKYVPAFCKWLRKSGIDEILQSINVLKGEMSLVGPRPLLLEDLEIINEKYPDLYKRRIKVNALPGITGYWQVYGDREKGIKNLVECDEFYERNKSHLLDLKIIVKTFFVMLTASHSDAINFKKEKTKKYNVKLADNSR